LRFARFSAACLWLLLAFSSISAVAQVNVYTRSYDNARSGANLQETILTPANVNSAGFGKLFTVHTDGEIYAQPLLVSNLAIAGGTHNVVFVASMLNTVYALDADTGATLWTQNFGSPIIPQDVENDGNIIWATRLGILGTPVIDPATNIMYFVSGSQPADGAPQYSFRLNAIEIATGLPVHGSPVTIAATYSTADLTNPLVFNAKMQNPRPGLALGNGNVYLAFASHEDQQPYHGFVMAYSTSTLAQTAVYSDTTIGGEGGIWNAGQAPSIDAAGNLYLSTGNGSFGKTPNGLVQTGNSFIKLSPTLELLDYFTPTNSGTLNGGDQDLGSSGVLLIPNTNYLLGGGKQGVLYLVNTNGMGQFNSSTDQVRQEFQAIYGKGTSHIHGAPVYFSSDLHGPTTYVWGENDFLRGFEFNSATGLVNTTPFATSTMTAPVTNNDGAMPGGFLSISANGDDNGILWASTPYHGDAVHGSTEGVLYAFNADTLALLWTDKTNDARDEIGNFAKYVPPVVANGKVYVPNFGPVHNTDGSGNLVVYGLLKSELTVAVANAAMTAGAALPTLTGTVTGLVNGDTLGTTIIVTYSTTATSSSPAGTYPITATVTGSSADDYQVVVNSGMLTISSSSQVLTVAANNAARVYGTANPTFSGTVTGAQNGDTFTEGFATSATTNSNIGTYAIVPSATGANLADYTVVIDNGTLTVSAAATTTTLSTPVSAAYGSTVTLTATVASTSGTPSGTVTFLSGSTTLGTGTLNTGGVASLGTATLPVGADSVTATYAAAGNFSASASTASSVTINAASQTITFPPIASRAYGSAPFAVTATSSAGTGYPVTITVKSGPAVMSGGVVTLTGAGTVVLQATQAGNADYTAATATQSFQVTPAPLTVAANNAGRAFGAANPAFSGTVTGAVGSDSFTESFTTTATANSNVGGYPIVPAATGSRLANYTVGIVDGALTVSAAQTTTALSAPGTAAYGASVTLTATVASTSGIPAGSVTFYDGLTSLGSGTLNASGVATLTSAVLPAGTDTVTAAYAALGNYAASASTATTITVNAKSQIITFAAIASRVYGSAPFSVSASSSLGNSYPVTIIVQSGPATIGGSLVSLTGAGTVVLQATQAGNTEYGPATATQSFQVTPAALTVAANSATRAYGATNPVFSGTVSGAVGSDSFSESFTTTATASSNTGSFAIVPSVKGTQLSSYNVTTVDGTLTVTAAATAITLDAPASAVYGTSVTLTATVTAPAGTPAGTVIFYSGSTLLGAGTLNGDGVATLSTTTLLAGTDAVTATYAAAGNFAASSSPAVTLTITAAPAGTPAGYTVAASPASLTIHEGGTGATTLTFTPVGGYSGTIALSCSNLPATATCSFAQGQVTLRGNNQSVNLGLTISTTKQKTAKQAPSHTPQNPISPVLLALAFWWPGGLTGLAVFARKRKLVKTTRLGQLCLLLVCTWGLVAGLAGCGMSGFEAHVTPASTSRVTVVATGTSGASVTTQSVVLTVNMTP
jgi:Bacterial Ig-like domain (group 3)/MBG domain (YGX type)/PQQ enzyme repeat